MEHWTVGHGITFAFGFVLVYMFGIPTKLIKTTKAEVALVFKSILTVLTLILLLSLASIANTVLGISGTIAVLAGGLFGLQMAAMPAFSSFSVVPDDKKLVKRPPKPKRQ